MGGRATYGGRPMLKAERSGAVACAQRVWSGVLEYASSVAESVKSHDSMRSAEVEPSVQIIQVNEYNLRESPDAYLEAIRALSARTEEEGHPGVVSYQFYVNRAENTAGAAIVFADAEAWLAHHQMAYEWEEMPRLQATVALTNLMFLGPFNDEMEQWISTTGLSYARYDTFAAGFSRKG